MYDDTEDVPIALTLGPRYEGQRKPSAILDALEGDLEQFSYWMIEGGHGVIESHASLYQARAWRALCANHPEFDATIGSDDDEGWLGDSEVESLYMARAIEALCDDLDSYTPSYTRYGWRSNDPEDDGYERLGVWIDWDLIDKDLETGKLARIDHPDDLTPDYAATLRQGGANFALWDADGDLQGDLELYNLLSLRCEWSA